tara:strand:- start:5141 stop:6292 length:1152 start_codon:yes stop_codon:yes gene_type:complete
MDKIIKKNNIKGPVELLFSRSQDLKKKDTIYYNMSGQIPKIKVETDSSSRPTVKVKNPLGVKGIDIIKDDSDSEESVASGSSGDTVEPTMSLKKESKHAKKESKPVKSKGKFNAEDYQNFINSSKAKNTKNESESGSDSGDSDEYSDEYSEYSDVSGSDVSKESNHKSSKKEKQEILLKLVALEKRGITLTKKYSLSSKLSDLKFELDLHKTNAEIEASVKFQQKVLMAAVTGLEFANKTFDPIGAKLDGWSESVMDNLDDYESIFIKLYEKYKTRTDLPPELQLFVTLVGSAFMFHITKTMFNSALGGGGGSNDILKNISSAMAGMASAPPTNVPKQDMTGPSLNLASMLGGNRDDDVTSNSTVETSKEITVNQKGKRSLNL